MRSGAAIGPPLARGKVLDVAAGAPVRFTFRPLDEGNASEAKDQFRRSTLAWLMSSDRNVVLHAPAVHVREADRRLGGERTVQIPRIDPGIYDLWLFQLHSLQRNPQGQPVMEGRHFTGSPFRLHVRAAPAAGAGSAEGTGGERGVVLPKRRCSLGSPEVYDGRWIRCSSACLKECTRDGWVFVPWDCSYRLYKPEDAATTAGKVARQRGRPLWIVVFGVSYTRGILHTLADLLCDGRCGFFNGAGRAVPRRGSALKCWGWFDYIHGNIRLSYQDWRMKFLKRNESDTVYRQRLAQVIREGPDLLLLQSLDSGPQDWLFHFYKQHMPLLESWRGTMVLLMDVRNTAGGGLDLENWDFGSRRQDEFHYARQGFMKRLNDLEIESPGIKEKTLLWNINPMLWSTLYDMEHLLGSGRATQHWHRYSKPGTRRAVEGVGMEMAAQILLAHLVEKSSKLRAADHGAAAGLSSYRAGERILCVNCPERACCPWLKPTPPNYTLSVPRSQLKLSATVSTYGCLKDP